MKLSIFLVLSLAACGDNETPLPVVEALPACADLGCPDLAAADKLCGLRGSCSCAAGQPRGTPPAACAAPCDELPCDAIACGMGVEEGACTCAIGELYASCRD